MKMIDHNHFICHLILGTFTEYPILKNRKSNREIPMFLRLDFLFFRDLFSCFYSFISVSSPFNIGKVIWYFTASIRTMKTVTPPNICEI